MSLILTGGVVVAEYLAGKVADHLGKRFRGAIIERWSRHRSTQFIETFCAAVVDANREQELDRYLDELISDEKKSAALFDAYRRVVLSASPTIGPRIIALVTATIVQQNRQPTPDEEQIMSAAERLTDSELVQTMEWFEGYREHRGSTEGPYTQISLPGKVGGVNLWDEWGTWAGKLSLCGFISYTVELVSPEKSEQRNRINLQPRLQTVLQFSGAIKMLSELVRRVSQMAH